jgi:hypothetical protein
MKTSTISIIRGEKKIYIKFAVFPWFHENQFVHTRAQFSEVQYRLFSYVKYIYVNFFLNNAKSTYNNSVYFNSMLSGSTVTTAWHVLGLRIEETASRYGG